MSALALQVSSTLSYKYANRENVTSGFRSTFHICDSKSKKKKSLKIQDSLKVSYHCYNPQQAKVLCFVLSRPFHILVSFPQSFAGDGGTLNQLRVNTNVNVICYNSITLKPKTFITISSLKHLQGFSS